MAAGRSKLWQLNLFSFFVTESSRFLMLRDRLRGVPRRLKRPAGGDEFFFASGGRRLAGVLVAAGGWAAGGLVCHGDWGDGGALERGAGLAGGTPGWVDGLQLLGVW